MKKILFLAVFAAIVGQLNAADGEMKALPFYESETQGLVGIPTGEVPMEETRPQGFPRVGEAPMREPRDRPNRFGANRFRDFGANRSRD